jgi:cytochrome P450
LVVSQPRTSERNAASAGVSSISGTDLSYALLNSFDPTDAAQGADPYERYAALRRDQPVSESMAGFLFLARHDDCSAAFRDARTFSSALGMRVHGQRLDPAEQHINEIDPPRHTKLRRLLVAAFSPATVHAIEPAVVELARDLVDEFAADGKADLVSSLSVPLPVTVIAKMLGIPPEDRHDFKRWSDDMMVYGTQGRDTIPTIGEFNAYLDEQIRGRRETADPPDDLVTRLIAAEVDGEHLTDHEIRTQMRFLVLAGNETTTNLIGNCVYELIRHGLWRSVRADRALVPIAIEETLRYNSPVQFVPRTCAAATERSHTPIAEGQRVLLGIGSANRDESVFDTADQFTLDRADVPHLSFGYGPHMCIGAALARMEARVAITELLDRFPDLDLAPGFEYEKAPMIMVRGPVRLDVTFTPPA